MKKLLLIASLFVSHQAQAAFWTSDFTITNLYVAAGQNYHYRVYGMPALTACPAGTNMAYLNEADSGAKGQIAALLMAYTSGKQVRLFVETDANQLCRILEIFISG